MRHLPLFLLAGCVDPTLAQVQVWTETTPFEAPGCGDGVLDPDEACDDGADNSDTLPDACRTTCLLPSCGDGVADIPEGCDDGDTWGGDGCTPDCAVETGIGEVEPNDTFEDVSSGGALVHGSLPEGDTDCFTVAVSACGAVAVEEIDPCDQALVLSLHDPTGGLVAAGGTDDVGCAILDPAEEPGARWLTEGTWAVCVTGVGGADVRGYSLALSTPDPVEAGLPTVGADTDGDAVPDACDADVDGDGLDNDVDNCPTTSNGPDTRDPALSGSGYIRHWLEVGPFTTGASTEGCRPSTDPFAGEDAGVEPVMGTDASGLPWTARLVESDILDFLPTYGGVGAPREAYAAVYLRSETARTLTLAVGADDGLFAWWNGVQVLDVASCQGVVGDQFQAPVEVQAGWNLAEFKVRDQGGGWGLAARFLDGSTAVIDLEPSLVPDSDWKPDQADADADGVGDVCDSDP